MMLEEVFWGLSIGGWITLATVVGVFSLLFTTKWSVSYIFLGGLTILLLTGVLSAKDAFAGFSSTSVIVVAILFVIVTGLENTGVLRWVSEKLLGSPKRYTAALLRLMLPVSFLSAFLSNTTVVAMFINVVTEWSKKLKVSPSKFLLPLSYASILGGVCTIIGTPPNLIIAGMYYKSTSQTIGFFDITPIGLICLVMGYLTILLFNRLLPNRVSASESFSSTKDFTVELLVPTDCPHIGKTIGEAQLENVTGGHLVEIISFDGEVVYPIQGDEFLMGGDRLIYTGNVENILKLKQTHGLVAATDHVYSTNDIKGERYIEQAVVPEYSSLIGHSLINTSFEKKYEVVLVAISREGKCVDGSPRQAIILAGDTLLLECKKNFKSHGREVVKEVVLIDKKTEEKPINGKTIVSSLLLVMMVGLTAFGILSLVESALIAMFGMFFTRCCSVQQGHNNINWEVIIIFACSMGIGQALERTGVATIVAQKLLSISGNVPIIALAAIFLVTSTLTEFVSNTAAAALLYPITFSTASSLGVNPMPFMIAVMVASSASFATPIGSPTHIMIYGPGGYRATDYLKIGLIMNLVIMATTVTVVPLLWPF